MSRANLAAVGSTALLLVLSSCVGGTSQDVMVASAAPSTAAGLDEPAHITGSVIDPELVPIAGAAVSVTPGELVVLTDEAGKFKIGPLTPGTFKVTAEKAGYRTTMANVTVAEDKPTIVTLKMDPLGSEVPYHETQIKTMFLYCAVAIHMGPGAGPYPYPIMGTAPCAGVVDIALQQATGQRYSNTLDTWTFDFKIEKNGFKSLVMEMTWPPQQFGTNGLMQLAELAKAEANTGGVTVGSTVYGGSMAQPYHDVIHAGHSYWVAGGKNVTFYPNANETKGFQMLIAGYYGNTTIPAGQSAVFINYKPTAYLTFFYNREATWDFRFVPDR